MPRGRHKVLPDCCQLHLRVPVEHYRVLEAIAIAEAVPFADYVRGVLERATQEKSGRSAALKRLRLARHKQMRRLGAAIATATDGRIEKHARTLVQLMEAEGPAA